MGTAVKLLVMRAVTRVQIEHQEPMMPPSLRVMTIVASRGMVTPSTGSGKLVNVGSPSPGC